MLRPATVALFLVASVAWAQDDDRDDGAHGRLWQAEHSSHAERGEHEEGDVRDVRRAPGPGAGVRTDREEHHRGAAHQQGLVEVPDQLDQVDGEVAGVRSRTAAATADSGLSSAPSASIS